MKNSEEKRREKASSFGFKVVERKHQLNSSSSSLGIETLSIMPTISASACVPDTSKDSSRYVPALDDLSSFAYQSQRSARDPHLIGGPFNPT
ncbi:hypothetical protein F2Q69_00027989 [Brassica cretica]|uniref:Uncharacterized protein n=1 Tax=Brassica cretica TaxID=69181 RepID=A0A8S9S304_BRACR|nr:hypothetical protein F2Q69_00027989 [Brassica cretica]